jgi:XTP/dITP diphosphohydrolase
MRRLDSGTKLVVASHNPGKVWEIKQLIAPYGLDAISAGDFGLKEPAETETTFEGNALLKARAAAGGSGLPALADDSGIEVAALDGAPGVYTADWAGPGKDFALAMQRVHDALQERGAWSGSPPKASFVSVLCLAWPTGEHRTFRGRVDGTLVWPARGGNGFGYDPMFVPEGATLTFGEMEPRAKYAISHRTRAFEAFKRECLAQAATVTAPDQQGRDLEALEAAARNLSTPAELVRFITSLRDDLVRHGGDWGPQSLEDFLAALANDLATRHVAEAEPRWRTIARTLLAASRKEK